MGKVLAVANNKGGVAKTTTACNLAHGLALDIEEQGEGVVLVDLDPQSSAARFFGVFDQVYHPENNPSGACISFYITGKAELSDTVIHLDRPEDRLPRPNLYLLPASRELEYTSEDLIGNETDRLRDEARGRRGRSGVPLDDLLSHYLAPLIEQFAYVILDCPPKLDTLKTAVYNVADYVIAPVQADYMSVSGLMEHTEDLAYLKEFKHVKAELALVVPTVVRNREVLDRQMRELLEETYGANRMADPIPASVSIKQSPAAGGKSIFEYKPGTPASDAYWSLVQRVRNELS